MEEKIAKEIKELVGDLNASIKKLNETLVFYSECQYWKKPVLTIDEVSRYTGIEIPTIKRMIVSRSIPHSTPSPRLHFFETWRIDKWMGSNAAHTRFEYEELAIEHQRIIDESRHKKLEKRSNRKHEMEQILARNQMLIKKKKNGLED